MVNSFQFTREVRLRLTHQRKQREQRKAEESRGKQRKAEN
jgi:hypothetical protein